MFSEWVKLVRTNSATWKRGNPKVYFDHVTLPGVPTDKAYQYRVVKGDLDLGTRPTYELNKDGSQTINLLEYNKGYGIHEETPINVFVVDPEDGMETLVAEWKPKSRRPPKTSE
ncbi:lectin FIP-fve [Gelatoporia subvermispora B]|uniref:Lectin FIP-fve n=1 Tax=Ceriporiopsis subvermispora (strain B) TaxID=914234 RepID=M2QVQ0_CERS8|nr:lectin FIP-fve [Gelatoporia subvermispora B]